MGELGMLTLDNGVTLQYSLYMGRCTAASPQEQSTEYTVSQSHSFSLSSLHHHTHSLCSATRVNYFIFFIFSFVEQFTLPCSQPTTLASIRGMGWSLGSLQFCHLNTPSPPTSSQQGVPGEQPLLSLLQAEFHWTSWTWTVMRAKPGGEGGTILPPYYPAWLGPGTGNVW